MCTAISYNAVETYFGRNLDVENNYNEQFVVMPRNYVFKTKFINDLTKHQAIIGTAIVIDGYPLYFDGMNESGLCMAALNFPNNAVYHSKMSGKINIAPYEFIPFILGNCKNVSEAENLLCKISVINFNFSEALPSTPLHWMISDGEKSITVESVKEGLRFYKNEVGVLTNNPPFLKQIENLEKYNKIFKVTVPQNDYSENFSVGLDGVGIPGDYSSKSRFVKTCFVKHRSPVNYSGMDAINQFFRILLSVSMPKNCVLTTEGLAEYTRYSCCFDVKKLECYYMTYNNFNLKRFSFKDYNLSSSVVLAFDF